MKHGKKYVESTKSVDLTKLYESYEALELVCKNAKANFDETVEAHIRLGVDSRHADQQVRGAVVLPNGIGKKVRICVFCKEDKYETAKAAGAEYIGGKDLVEKIIRENWIDFDVVIASSDMMSLISRLGKVLGPRGLMPTPKTGTVTNDIAKAITDVKGGKIEYRLDKTNIIHCHIGKVSFGVTKLEENFNTLMEAVVKSKPTSIKGTYIKSCTVTSTMGLGISIVTNKYRV